VLIDVSAVLQRLVIQQAREYPSSRVREALVAQNNVAVAHNFLRNRFKTLVKPCYAWVERLSYGAFS
ncbi:MAG: hypothetical protein OXM01_13255, partial [Gemmatimonadota bacterium]|nr:hypothetical protein [Gemmatimonadota bacterium]